MLLETIQTFLEQLQALKDFAFEAIAFPPANTSETTDHEDDGRMDYMAPVDDIPGGPVTESPSMDLRAVDRADDTADEGQSSLVPDDETSAFRFAHDFVIHNQTIISQIISCGDIGFRIIGEKRMIGAEVESSTRKYAPRCHPDTRKSLQHSVMEWIAAERSYDMSWERRERVPRMLWVMGPAGVGKSALAQTIAEKMKAKGQLGATLFFSRPDGRDDPEQVIPTLAYQLAVKHPKYKPILNQRLADDPYLLEKTLRLQFKELITDPFSIIMAQDPSTRHKPLLVILDGLDECNSEEAQCEFIELITEHVRSTHEFPLLWMVCSRPEWHFRYLLSRPDFPTTCRREHMTIDNPEARRDVALVLRDEFAEIYRRFSDYLPRIWPSEESLQTIIVKASGLFALATTITRFVGDTNVHDPQSQLQICLDCLNGLSERVGPFERLDYLYRGICSTIPLEDLPIVKRILGVCVIYSESISLPAQQLANFLGLKQSKFDFSLRKLHSVIKVPIGVEAQQNGIQFYHASFSDFLQRSERSSQYSVHDDKVYLDVAMRALQWQMHSEHGGPDLAWPNGAVNEDLLRQLARFSSSVAWKACSKVPGIAAHRVVEILNTFDFTRLEDDLNGFPEFISWLRSVTPHTQTLIHLRTQTCPPFHSIKRITLLDPENVLLAIPNLIHATPFFHIGVGNRCCEFEIRPTVSTLQGILDSSSGDGVMAQMFQILQQPNNPFIGYMIRNFSGFLQMPPQIQVQKMVQAQQMLQAKQEQQQQLQWAQQNQMSAALQAHVSGAGGGPGSMAGGMGSVGGARGFGVSGLPVVQQGGGRGVGGQGMGSRGAGEMGGMGSIGGGMDMNQLRQLMLLQQQQQQRSMGGGGGGGAIR
ncbi:hypothetical protein D9756_005088 [Leucocoprinus leucothites]|uniref:NACHT domain-containing protein n=1 Tax=Leucocoprinus leucothites TaxID=201217 RepID=A0A8H5LKB9_9AGAR|nr:hypothetical protein D9756_005088 [Leucoagaricus leucothites]